MAIKRLPMDSIEAIIKAGEIDAFGFHGMLENPADALTHLEATFRPGVERIIEDFDRRWTALCLDDEHQLTEWASRMPLVRGRLDEIDRHLKVKGTRLFNWPTVFAAMGFLNAFRVAIEQTLDYNEQRTKIA